MRSLSIFAVFVAVFALSGCVSLASYPKEWSPPADEPEGKCRDLTGAFENAGARVESDRTSQARLATFLIGSKSSNIDADRVELQHQGGKLRITLWSGDKSLYESTVDVATTCRGGELVIRDPEPEGGINREGIAGASSSSLGLQRSQDGALIARRTDSFAGIALLVPIAMRAREWQRYNPYLRR